MPLLVLCAAVDVCSGAGTPLPPTAQQGRPLWNTNIQTAIGLTDTESALVRGDGALLEPDGDIGFVILSEDGTILPFTAVRQRLFQGRYPVVITDCRAGAFSWTTTIYTTPADQGPCDVVELHVISTPENPGKARLAVLFYGDQVRVDHAGNIRVGARPVTCDADARIEIIPRKWGFEPGPDVRSLRGWAHPAPPADPAFVNTRAGFNGRPIVYRFRVTPGAACPTALGVCEGYWRTPGQRVLVLEVEGAPSRKIDTIRDLGPNKAGVFLFEGKDANNDGILTVTVRAAPEARDQNCILNTIWLLRRPFRKGDAERLRRHAGDLPLLYGVDCGGPGDHPFTPRPRIVWPMRTTRPDPQRHWLAVSHTVSATPPRFDTATLKTAKSAAVDYWRRVYARGVHLHIADPTVEDLWYMSIANVFMLRDRIDGIAVVKPGETCYDSFWYRDGAYLVLAQDMAGYPDEAQASLELFWRADLPPSLRPWGQQPDGSWAVPRNEWDGQGQAMWALWRHYRLTGDRSWLARVYPALRRGMRWIHAARQKTKTAPRDAPDRPLSWGLLPKGFGERIDGPLGFILYHDFWGVLGARCGWYAARELDTGDVDWMRREYEDFRACVIRCCAKAGEIRKDHALPGALGRPSSLIWGGIAAVYPCEALPIHSDVVNVTFRRMEQRAAEGLYRFVSEEKIWPYISTDWARACLYRGEYEKALNIFRAYCAHASPTRAWIEEIFIESRYGTGDMPHGWAAADYIMLLRDMLLLERGRLLHVMPCVDSHWLPVGESVELRGCLTDFGPVDCRLARPAPDRLLYTVRGTWRERPRQVVFHLPVGLAAKTFHARPGTVSVPQRTISATLPPGKNAALRIQVRIQHP